MGKSPSNPSIAAEIAQMVEVDQKMRKDFEASGEASDWDSSVDIKHTLRIKEIISQIGWPKLSEWGQEMVNQTWLLVQHCEIKTHDYEGQDLEFMEKCLAMMQALPPTEILPRNLAYLEDRINVTRHRPQRYGTQFDTQGHKNIPFPLADSIEITNARRAAIGMETMEEYQKDIDAFYGR